MSEFVQPGHEVKVEMFEWKILQEQGVIATYGLGPCIGVSFYNPDTKTGMLGHFPAQSDCDRDNFEAFLKCARENVTTSTIMRIWIGGGCLDGSGDDDSVLADRGLIFNRVLEELGDFSEIRTQWLDHDADISYAIDVHTGEEEIEVVSEEDRYVDLLIQGYFDDAADDGVL